MKRLTKAALLVVILTGAGIQFIPAGRTNRLGTGDPVAPREVTYIFRRACYDCHSTESRWPIWAYVAPMSWKVVQDVDRARAHLNFSDWASYDPARQHVLRVMVGHAVADHRMPAWYYLTLHPDARLSPEDRSVITAWATASVLPPLPPSDSTIR
jgi:hypothetical protein